MADGRRQPAREPARPPYTLRVRTRILALRFDAHRIAPDYPVVTVLVDGQETQPACGPTTAASGSEVHLATADGGYHRAGAGHSIARIHNPQMAIDHGRITITRRARVRYLVLVQPVGLLGR